MVRSTAELRGMNSETPAGEVGLIRAIGVRQLTAIIVNVTIGAGIFVLPAVVAADLGPAAALAYLACAALMTLVVWCFAAAGSRVSLTGGLYAYVEVAFGGYIGFTCGVLYWLQALFTVASVASAFAGSVGVLWAGANAAIGRTLVLAVLFGVLAFINVRGVKPGARLVEIMAVAKLLPLVVLVGVGVWFLRADYLRWAGIPTAAQVGRTSLVLIFAFMGIEIALVPSGEVINPARTVPRAIFLALAFTTLMYLIIQAVAQGLLGPSMSAYAAAPLAEAASRVLGSTGRLLVLGGAAVSMFGFVSGDMLGSPRALFAFGRDGVLPRALARVHPRFHTPALAIITYAIIAVLLSGTGSFTQLAVLANVVTLSMYLLCVAASYELQRRDVRASGPPFALPAGPLVPILAAAGILWLLSQASRREFAIEAAVLAVTSALYAVRRFRWIRIHSGQDKIGQ